MKKRILLAPSLLCGIAVTLFAQQPVAPPSGSAGDGPSLEVTMSFIQDKLNELGRVAFAESLRAGGGGYTIHAVYEYSNVIADASQCRISYHQKRWANGMLAPEDDHSFSLRDVQEVVVRPYEQGANEDHAKSGPPWVSTVTPAVTRLEVRRPHGSRNDFVFADSNLADRLAKALTHAVELCGGGNKDPF